MDEKPRVVTEGNNWVYYPDIDKKIYYHDFLLPNLKIMKRAVYHDRDNLVVVTGTPGSGKSVFGAQLAKYFDPNFSINNIYFEGEKLIRKLIDPNTPKYSAFVYDEAREGLNARASMSRQNRIITDCLAEIRQKNLFIIVILPDLWDLDSNVANKRSRYLFHVYETPNESMNENEDPFQRGNFKFYNGKAKTRLYINGKKYHDMDAEMPTFFGHFLNQYVVEEDKYRDMKAGALRTNRRLDEYDESNNTAAEYRRAVLRRLMEEFPGKPQIYWARILGVDQSNISRDLKALAESGEMPKAPGGLDIIT